MVHKTTVDYLVVGAGTAGCIVAARLSEDPAARVALLELGGMDTNPAIYDQSSLNPMYGLWDPKCKENWGYTTEPQAGLEGRSIDIARGRVLGGSSAVNAMIYARGNRRDFDSWASLGNEGWGYTVVLPYFKRSECYHGNQPREFHGDAGPLSITDYRAPSVAGEAFVEAAAALGATARHNDFNGASQEAGAGFYQSTKSPDGTRVTAGSAFITPNLGRPNLQLLTGERAIRLLFEGGRAVGVEIADQDGISIIRAEREIILSAGAYETPKLLLLSGLGPAAELATWGIPVIQDLPGVGKDLQDHMLLGVDYESLVPFNEPELLAEAGLFRWTRGGPDQTSPDLQYFFGPVQFVLPEYRVDAPCFTFAPILAQPLSRGTISLASTDPTVNARLDPQYLSREEDIAVFEYGIRYARELAHTEAFAGIRSRELSPGPEVTSSKDLRAFIRKAASTVWHPSSTCRMGTDPGAVVDPELRVRGVTGLRIVDASVLPKLVNANPNASIMMIAEKAADLIRGIPAPAPNA
jgi:choline dehydrogenase